MDLFGGESWYILIPIIILIVLSFVMKRRRPAERTDPEIAGTLFLDVNENLKLAESFSFQRRPKKFRTGSWQRNSEKVDFLPRTLQDALSTAFTLAEDFNQQIDAAKKYKSTIYLSGVDVRKLEGPLTKSKEGLEEWLKANIQQTGPEAGRRGCMGV